MELKAAQIIWAKHELYDGQFDGLWGPKCDNALAAGMALANLTDSTWGRQRLIIGTVQFFLNHDGFEAGTIDGYAGHNTNEALHAALHKMATGRLEKIDRTPLAKPVTIKGLPRQRNVSKFYGHPDVVEAERLTSARSPYPMRLDWDLGATTSKLRVHKLCAAPLEAALSRVHKHYGLNRIRELGLDRYAGGHNKRRMRGGRSWSMHAYGCAVDFFAQPNGLRVSCPQALFCGPEYKPFLDIMEAHGWLPAVRLWGKDAMHFQMAKL